MIFNIGVDFGGVLSVDDTKSEHRNTTVDMPDAIKSLQILKEAGHRLFLISFCGKSRAIETRKSLEETGIYTLFEAMFFTKKPEYKKYICTHVGCHFMIDDNEDVLAGVAETQTIPILFRVDWNSVTSYIISYPFFHRHAAAAGTAMSIDRLCYLV